MVNLNLKKYLAEIEKNNQKGKKINAILQVNPCVSEDAKKVRDGKLAGKIIAVKANINVRGLTASCASKTLENYKCPYDATVIKKIKNEGGVIISMTNMDEFACGWSGETSAFGPTKNPQVLELVAGGSSSGSAAAVAAGFCDVALGSDTGGSIRNPASHCGVVGVKPSYGVVSRYGLIDLSMSLDQIGPLAKNVEDAKLLFDVIKGKDEKDATSFDLGRRGNSVRLRSGVNKNDNKETLKIGLLDTAGLNVDSRITKIIEDKINEIAKKNKWVVKKIKIPYIELAVQTYYPLVYVEFFSGTRKFDVRRYGKIIDDGSLSNDVPNSAMQFQLQNKLAESHTLAPPAQKSRAAKTHPDGENKKSNTACDEGIPVGMQIMADKFCEEKLFQVAGLVENV